jgi:hypothetical protein
VNRDCRRWVGSLLSLGTALSLTSCGDQPTEGTDAGSSKREGKTTAIHQNACTAVQTLWADIAPYLGGQPVDPPAPRRSIQQLSDATEQLRDIDPDSTLEFDLTTGVAYSLIAYERTISNDPDSPSYTDLPYVWSGMMQIVDRTCRQWGVDFTLDPLGTGGG